MIELEESTISGRPILEQGPAGAIHLAFYRDSAWWTWCGERVRDDHRCPDQQTLDRQRVYYLTNCRSCHERYRELGGLPWRQPKVKREAV
jgi:hypothetical protein